MTKEKVLAMLIRSGDYISGEEISKKLGITRAAVNGAVKTLKGEGCAIESVTNRGYRLREAPDVMSFGAVAGWLPEGREDRLAVFPTVSSTNTWLKSRSAEGLPDGFAVIADEQTAGRGRLGRRFDSQSGKGVYLSMLLRPDCAPSEVSCITAWTAVAVCDAIEKVCGVRPQVKWINDIVLGGKKICGILTEMSLEGESGRIQQVIVGIGVNVNNRPEDFPEELQGIASSLFAQTGVRVDREHLAAELIASLDKMYESWPEGKRQYLAAYRDDCLTTGRQVALVQNGIRREAFAERIDDDFALVVKRPDGTYETVFTGEASVRGLFGYV